MAVDESVTSITDNGKEKPSSPSPEASSKKSHVSKSNRKSKHGTGRSKSPDDDLILSDRSPHRHNKNRRSTSRKPSRSKSNMSSSPNRSNDALAVSDRSPHRRKSSKTPRRSKSTDDSDSLVLSHRSSGGRRRSSQRPTRSKSTMSETSNTRNDPLSMSARSSSGGHRRRSSQRPRSNSTMSASSDRLTVSERSSKSARHRRSSNEEVRTSKRKARLSRDAAAPGAFYASDDDKDLLGPSSAHHSRKSRQSKLDQEAKRQARSLSLTFGDVSDSDASEEDPEMALKLANARYSNRSSANGPGVVHASNTNPSRSREARKSERHSARNKSTSPMRNNANSKRRSSQGNADEIAKRRSKHGNKRASMPGAAQSISIDMAARKERRQHASMMAENEEDEEQLALKLAGARYRGKNAIGTRLQRPSKSAAAASNAKNNKGDGLIEAVVVGDSNEEAISDNPESSSNAVRSNQSITQGDIEQHRIRVQAQAEHNQRAMEADVQQKAREKRKRRNRNIVILLILLAIAGVAAYFLLQTRPWASSSATATVPEEEEPSVVSDAPAAPTENEEEPSGAPSTPPTKYLKYDPPDAEDCADIAAGLRIDIPEGQEVFNRNYDVITEVDLEDDQDLEPVLPQLKEQIEEILMPKLAGCNDNADGQDVAERRLQNNVENIRNVIADGLVSVRISEDLQCTEIQSDNCRVVIATLDLRLLGEELVFYITVIIDSVFKNSLTPLVRVLQLENPYVEVLVVTVENKDPTTAPSESPSGSPSSIPSEVPSYVPSLVPSIAPFPGSTSSPTCASVATNFDSQSFLERSGTQDATYTVPCGTGTTSKMVVLRRLNSGCQLDCVADLELSDFEQVCNQENAVDVTLTGDYSQSTLFIGLLDTSTSYVCTGTLQLETQSPSQTPSQLPTLFPTIAESGIPTLFPTPTPTAVPVLDQPPDESDAPTVGESMQPSLFPSSAPTSRYIGCFEDDYYARDFFLFHHAFSASEVANVDTCIESCRNYGYSYAGIQVDEWSGINQCHCGNNFGSYGNSTRCSGEYGGLLANSVYTTNILQGWPEQELPEGLECGCYNDNGIQTQDYELGYGESVSQRACIIGCQLRGYDFAGLSSGGECRCIDNAGTHGEADPESEGFCYSQCNAYGPGACYGENEDCDCGGYGSQTSQQVFRTSLQVECPSFDTEAPTPVPTSGPTNAPTSRPTTSNPTSGPTVTETEEPSPPELENLIVSGLAFPTISSYDFEGVQWYGIDGDTCEGNIQQCSAAQTSFQTTTTSQPELPWYQVDLGFTAAVHVVTVWPGGFPMGELVLELIGNDGEEILATSTFAIGQNPNAEIEFQEAIEGVRYIRLVGTNEFSPLSIAEVEVFGYGIPLCEEC